MLCLVFVTGSSIWLLPGVFCFILGLAAATAFLRYHKSLSLPPRTISRLILFILFWFVLKLVLHYLPLFWSYWLADGFSSGQFPGALRQAAGSIFSDWGLWHDAALFCTRLGCLLVLGILLAGLYSPYTLACAFNWCLSPLRSPRSWRVALALALLLHYLPRIIETLDAVRMAARIRGLPSTGRRYWRVAFPRFFAILAQQTWAQAVAVCSRNLDSPSAWHLSDPLPKIQLSLLVLYALTIATVLLS